MHPLSQLHVVPPEMPAVKALEMMARENLTELPVVSKGTLQGVFSRGQLMRYLQIHLGESPRPRDRAA